MEEGGDAPQRNGGFGQLALVAGVDGATRTARRAAATGPGEEGFVHEASFRKKYQ